LGTLYYLQLFLLLLGGSICILIFFFSTIVNYQSALKKKAILNLEFFTAVLLYSDFFAYVFRGNTSTTGYWVVHISNFLLFFVVYLELIGLQYYLKTCLLEAHKKDLFRLIIIRYVSYAGILGLIVNTFTGFIYKINDANLYTRGPFFFISFVLPLVAYLLFLSIVIEYRKIFPKLIFIALLLFFILPLSCSILQCFLYGLSLMNLAIGFCVVLLFALSLISQNRFLVQAACREIDTGLPNTYGLNLEMQKLIEEKILTRYNAFYFDIKRMGVINRKYGGKNGTLALVTYAHSLKSSLKEDEVLGRLSGNLFVALIRKENTQDFLERLTHTEISLPLPDGVEKIVMSSVAGIYEIDTNDIEPGDILSNALMATNIAKHIQHKPYVFLTPELQKEIDESKALQDQIPISMGKGEFKPYYQPKIDVSDNTLCGAEALVRWEHNGEIIPPGKFISELERNESICKLDFYVLDYVCRDIRKWLDEGKNPPAISVNFSRKNLGNPVLAEQIHDTLKKYNIPENLIQVEITETIDEYPVDYLKGVVLALRDYGMSTALDDFGTGSASINLIKEVPFNVMKIDKSFIDSLNDKDQKILGHIISLAADVGSDVITEGVETSEQLSVVKKLGCTKIQGFYFDKPLPRDVFESRMDNPVYRTL